MRAPGTIDRRIVLATLLVLLLAWGFVKIADEVREGDVQSLDERILLLFRVPGHPETPIGPGWLANAARDVTALGSTSVLFFTTVAVAGYLLIAGRKRTALFLVVAVAGGALLSTSLKLGFARPRPEVVGHLDRPMSPSFPSGHSMVSAVVYLTLGALLARSSPRRGVRLYVIGLVALMAFAIGITRLYLGVHYPTDVLAGWIAGTGWAMLCWVVARLLQRRGAVEPAGGPGPGPGPGPG